MSARAAAQAPAQDAQVPSTTTAVDAPKENIFMFVPNLIGTLRTAYLRIRELTWIQATLVSFSQSAH